MVAQELQVAVKVEVVNLFLWKQLEPEHLALAPLGSLPVLVTAPGRALVGRELMEGLQQLSSSTSPGISFKNGDQWSERLEQVSISALTHGMSLHPGTHSVTLRFPYHQEDYCTMASNYILSRTDRLLEAAERERGRDSGVSEGLVRLAQQHQASLQQYLQPQGYDTVVQSFHVLLDELEAELSREGRVGVWLGGGGSPSLADITLGLYLHRIWQLGLETEYFEEGVRPQLSVFYTTIKSRPAFMRVTRWKEETGTRKVKSETDQLADSAKMGLGAAAVLGGLFLVKKLLRK